MIGETGTDKKKEVIIVEDSQTLSRGNEALIQEMLRDAHKAEVPSELQSNPVIHKGDTVLPSPVVVKELSGAGYIWVWDTRTFEKVPVLTYMIPAKLRMRRPDGSYRWTTTDPGLQPKRGTIKCMLHYNAEHRVHYNELGFRLCKKDNITNDYQLQQHMIKKHPQEWAALKAEREAAEKAEDRALQRLILAERSQPKEVNKVNNPEESILTLFACKRCGKGYQRKDHYQRHIKNCK